MKKFLVFWVCLIVLPAMAQDLRLWPLFYHKADVTAKSSKTEVFWPLYARTATDAYTAHQIVSFQRRFPSQFRSQAYVFWPFSGWRYDGDAGHDAWLFPFFWSASDERHFVNALLPAWYYSRRGSQHHLNIALLNHNYWTTNKHRHFFLPLAWGMWDDAPPESNFYSWGLFPAFSVYHDSRHRHRWGNMALFYYRHRRSVFRDGELPRDSCRRYGLFPVADRHYHCTLQHRDDTLLHSTTTYLFPYWQKYRRVEKAIASQDVGTVAGAATTIEEHFRAALPPVYYRQHRSEVAGDVSSSRTWLLPYYGRRDHEEKSPGLRASYDLDSVLPLYWHGRRSEMVLADSRIALTDRSLLVLPYYERCFIGDGSQRRSHNLLLAGWGDSQVEKREPERPAARYSWYRYLLPCYFHSKQGTVATTPGSDGDDYDHTLWLAPYWYHAEREGALSGRTDFLAPLYYRSDVEHIRHGWWTPLYGNWQRQASPRSKAALADLGEMDWGRDNCRSRWIFPCWYESADYSQQSWWLIPLLGRKSDWLVYEDDRAPTWRGTTWLPLLLASHVTLRGDRLQHRNLNVLCGLYRQEKRSNAEAVQWRMNQLFPLWHYSGGEQDMELRLLCPPFSYTHLEYKAGPSQTHTEQTRLSIPARWLPLYRWRHRSAQRGSDEPPAEQLSCSLWPFFNYERMTADDFHRLSILAWLYQREERHGEVHAWGLGGGLSNSYDRDINGFSSRSVLYRLYRREEHSWSREWELMPFISATNIENGDGGWSILGGLFGSWRQGATRTNRVLFVPWRTRCADSAGAGNGDDALAKRAAEHVGYALNYLQSRRFELAAVEFMLAKGAFEHDSAILLQAGDAYAMAKSDGFYEYFRKDTGSSVAYVANKGEQFRQARSVKVLRQTAIDFYEQAIAAGADRDLTELKIALCRWLCQQRAEACVRMRARYERTGRSEHAVEYLGFVLADGDLPAHADDIRALARRFPDSVQLAFICYQLDCKEEKLDSASSLQRLRAMLAMPAYTLPEYPPLPAPIPWYVWKKRAYAIYGPLWQGRAFADYGRLLNTIYDALADQIARLPAAESSRVAEQQRLKAELWSLIERSHGELQLLRVYLRRDLWPDDHEYLQELQLCQTRLAAWPAPKESIAEVEALFRRQQWRLSWLRDWELRLVEGRAGRTGVGPLRSAGGVYVDLDQLFGQVDHCLVEARCVLRSAQAQEVILHLGFDHEASVELNGQRLFGPVKNSIARIDQHTLTLPLQAGANSLRILLRDDTLSFGFYARCTDAAGTPVVFAELYPAVAGE